MVQKKVVNKLGIQADHVKYNKPLVSLKPSSLQHQDTKNRGADMKKKMKKSRSVKHSDFERLSTPSLKRQIPQPGKPPPSVSPSSAATPQKKSPTKTSDTTPNYMKSTSSFDGRKEQSQVSCRNLLPLFDSKSSSKKNSNNSSSSEASSASAHKPARTLARPSSLKLVRNLTKTTCFKPARASVNKCSPLALSENLNVQRATCSSTLKDSKFPAYLTLDSGGREAEGTSALKVCPYNYCSLNGHHHPPLPPLKSFLSARRRMMKTQRSIKLGCLSPRRSKPSKEAMEEREMGKVNFDDKSSSKEASNSSVITPVIQQEYDDFFIHVYSKERETVADTGGTSKLEEDDLFPSDASPNYHSDSQVPQSLLDESSLSDIGYHDNSNENSGSISRDKDTAEYSPEENQKTPEVDEVYPHPFVAEESGLEGLSREHVEEESTGYILIEDPEFGHSDMDWEEGRYSTFYLDDEVDNSLQTRQDYDLGEDPIEYDSFVIPDGSIFESDGTVNKYFKEIQAGEIQARSFDEESMSSNADSHQAFEIDEHVQVSGNQSHDWLELTTMDEKNDGIKQSNPVATFNISMNPLGDPIEEPCANFEAKSKEDNETAEVDPQVEDAPSSTIQAEVDAFTNYCENQFQQDDDAAEQTCDLHSQDFHDMTAQRSPEEYKDATGSQKNVNLYQTDAPIVINCTNCQASSGNTPPKEKDPESETNCVKIDAGVAVKEKEEVGPSKANITIEIIITLQALTKAVEMESRKDIEDNHLDSIATDGKSNQTVADIDLAAETQDHTSDEKFVDDGIKNLNSLEENEAANFTSCHSTDSGDQPHSPTTEFSLADTPEQNAQDTEMETKTILGEETCPTSKSTSGTQTGDDLLEDNLDQELGNTCKKLNWINKRKTSTEEQEEPKEFNPRAPNFLPLKPEQEAEKVDLRHQMIDDRRNSEEWMLDYALQRAVTKLAPARKKKVALLVEAFEKVLPVPKCETQIMHASVGFAQSPPPIQACS